MKKNDDFFKNGIGHIVSSSHNDIAWWNTPYKTMAYRDFNIISPAIEMVKEDRAFKHTMECVLYLMEYLQRHPEQKETLHQLACEQRLMWGATYTQPYENMLNDEALIRQVYLGKKWFDKTFPGACARVAWSPDVPGRAMQFPQVLQKSGVDYLMISRVDAGAFEWFSPDGSSVKGFSSGHYFTSAKALNAPCDQAIQNVAQTLSDATVHYTQHNLPPHYLFLSVADYVAPKNYSALIEAWPEKEARVCDVPTLKHSSVEEFMDELTSNPDCTYRTYHGERPNEWAYIHGATHHEGIAYGRQASAVLPEAETFSTIHCLLENTFDSYPTQALEESWKNLLYADHGFGGGNGHITDQVFTNAMKKASCIAQDLKVHALEGIAKHIQSDAALGLPLIIFNTKSYTRTDIVRYALDLRNVPAPYFIIEDTDGNPVDYQVVDETNAFELTIEFVATEVPSIGYKTYYIKPSSAPTKNIWLEETHLQRTWLERYTDREPSTAPPLKAPRHTIENDFYKIVFTQGGLSSIYDKALEKELLDTKDYRGFELFMLKSKGTGAGEFKAIEQPTLDFSDSMKNYTAEWEIIAQGSLKTTLRLESKFSCCYVIQTISIYHTLKKIDCDIELVSFDGTPDREFRLALPLNLTSAQVTYDVPMGAVEIGKDEVRGAAATEFFRGIDVIHYPTPCDHIHPREVQDWMSATDHQCTVLLSSDVSLFDYINPRTQNPQDLMLQPILLASRRSCHGWGNEYLQRGSHTYHFSFTSHSGDWRENVHQIAGANHPLVPVIAKSTQHATLPSTLSFFSVDQPQVVISALKKCEDDNHLIVRTYENHGTDCDIQLQSFMPISHILQTDMIENVLDTQLFHPTTRFAIGKRSIDTFKFIL